MIVDSTPDGQQYKSHHVLSLGHKTGAKLTPKDKKTLNKKHLKKIKKKYDERGKNATISSLLEEPF